MQKHCYDTFLKITEKFTSNNLHHTLIKLINEMNKQLGAIWTSKKCLAEVFC